jgi:hypothetical protein
LTRSACEVYFANEAEDRLPHCFYAKFPKV